MLKLECEAPGAFRDDSKINKKQDKQKNWGATVQARAEHILAVEVPTKRAISDEARYSKGNTINNIALGGPLTKDKKGIDAFVQHTLFTTIEAFKKGFLHCMPRLDDEVRNTIE